MLLPKSRVEDDDGVGTAAHLGWRRAAAPELSRAAAAPLAVVEVVAVRVGFNPNCRPFIWARGKGVGGTLVGRIGSPGPGCGLPHPPAAAVASWDDSFGPGQKTFFFIFVALFRICEFQQY